MLYNIPAMMLNVFLVWCYLVLIYTKVRCPLWWSSLFRKSEDDCDDKSEQQRQLLADEKASQRRISRMLHQKYCELGSITFHELAVFLLFLLVVFLWLFRAPKFITGWGDLIPTASVGDSTPAILVVLLLFLIPKDLNAFFGRSGKKNNVSKYN